MRAKRLHTVSVSVCSRPRPLPLLLPLLLIFTISCIACRRRCSFHLLLCIWYEMEKEERLSEGEGTDREFAKFLINGTINDCYGRIYAYVVVIHLETTSDGYSGVKITVVYHPLLDLSSYITIYIGKIVSCYTISYVYIDYWTQSCSRICYYLVYVRTAQILVIFYIRYSR